MVNAAFDNQNLSLINDHYKLGRHLLILRMYIIALKVVSRQVESEA